MNRLLHYLLFALGIGVFNAALCWVLGLTTDSQWFPLFLAWCGASGTVVGMIAAETAP